MRKKFMLGLAAVFAAASMSLTSCSGDPADKAADIFRDAAQKLENADTHEEIRDIAEELNDKGEALEAQYPDFRPDASQKEKIRAAEKEYRAARKAAKRRVNEAVRESLINDDYDF